MSSFCLNKGFRLQETIMCLVTKYSTILGVFQQPWPGVSPIRHFEWKEGPGDEVGCKLHLLSLRCSCNRSTHGQCSTAWRSTRRWGKLKTSSATKKVRIFLKIYFYVRYTFVWKPLFWHDNLSVWGIQSWTNFLLQRQPYFKSVISM